MKVKIKDEIDDIRLKLNHRELVLIKNALMNLEIDNLDNLNRYLFDCQEYENEKELEKDIKKMISKIHKKLFTINPW